MIFKGTWEKVLDGTKTQTRRPIKAGELFYKNQRPPFVQSPGGLWKYVVNNTYAIQPGRGKKSLGRIRLEKIRLEHVQNISCKDMIAEGLSTNLRETDASKDLLRQWENLWNSLYKGTKFAYENNPKVWVLEFELVEKY